MHTAFGDRASRATFIRNAAAAGAGLTLSGLGIDKAHAAATAGACTDSVQTIINTALIAERLATTFYYTALTTPAIMSDSRLGGSSLDPTNPGQPPDGNPGNVRYLQAALDTEVKHAAALTKAGATASLTQFYFPQAAFSLTGSSTDAGTFLGVLDALETAFIGAYLAAISRFVTLGHADLAELAANIMGTESEHRAMGRVIANLNPADNLAFEQVPFGCVSDAGMALQPFLSGNGFPFGATAAIPLPSDAMTSPVIGTFGTRILTMFV